MNHLEWQKISETEQKVGFRTLQRKIYRLPNGHQDEWTVLKGSPVSLVLALTPDLQVICAVQFRPGPEKVCTDMPGGGVDPGETPQQAAIRELHEETGYEPGEVIHLASTPNDAYSGAIHHHFLALGCRQTATPTFEEGEYIEVRLLSISELLASVYAGGLGDATTVFMGIRELQKRGLLAPGV